MRKHLAALAAAAVLTFVMAPAPASAISVGTASSIQESLSKTDLVEKARRVCRRNFWTGRQECWVDRSRPPTVCHRIRGTNRMDCY